MEFAIDSIMYAPIENSDTPAISSSSQTRILFTVLAVCAWIGMLLFGICTAFHYVRRAFVGQMQGWDTTDPGLYRVASPISNGSMLLHFVAGVILMVLGPIQLIAWMRRNHINIHRVIGRIYISSALIAATCATFFVVCFGTSRGNRYEEGINTLERSVVFPRGGGSSMFVPSIFECALPCSSTSMGVRS